LRNAGSAVILPHATLAITAAMKTSAMEDGTALIFIMSMLLYILRTCTEPSGLVRGRVLLQEYSREPSGFTYTNKQKTKKNK
jgi:hypothetical protein